MTPILIHFFAELWDVMKRVPWWAYVSIALVSLWLWDRHQQYDRGYHAAEKYYELRIEAEKQIAENEQKRLKESFGKIKNLLLEEQQKGYEKRDKVIADWQSGRLRLKARFSPTSCPASGSNERTTTGFLEEDVQFFVRESARADGVVRQLQACQGVISEYQKTSK